MPLFDFRCPAGHVTEAIRSSGVAVIACACGEEAQRQAVARIAVQIGAEADWKPIVRDNGHVRVPVKERRIYLRQYDEATQQIEYEHRRAEESAQQPLPEPPLWQMAKAKADRLMKAGVNDSLDMPK